MLTQLRPPPLTATEHSRFGSPRPAEVAPFPAATNIDRANGFVTVEKLTIVIDDRHDYSSRQGLGPMGCRAVGIERGLARGNRDPQRPAEGYESLFAACRARVRHLPIRPDAVLQALAHRA